ncbi:hypothetical protein KUTeg_024349 [Tegillarca granosa]|uniref:Uncharacterized protein n=1 Tax=Tegillarca granosa TaxID=220873 RepID=A0ABQ9DX31_TEGGR|nr:hypothetical protein KUTeg_024349 [Tegillarca granosa]
MEEQEEICHNKMVVVAIDFGTTYSGYAFSLTSQFCSDNMKICTNTAWIAGSGGLMSYKAPTCVLLDKDKQFQAFGYEAEDRYAELAIENKHHDVYFFKKFKMLLHRNPYLSRDTMINDETGKSMLARVVFAHGIEYLKNHAMDLLNQQGFGLEEWEAGIMNDQLLIALEPEAASVFCRHLPDARGSDVFKSGSRYMVVDLGGGTADITVHEVDDRGKLRELNNATGGAWGGTKVDAAFFQLLTDIVGEEVMGMFWKDHKSDAIDLNREFEVKKRTIKKNMGEFVQIKIPIVLKEKYEKVIKKTFAEAIDESMYKGRITIIADKLKFDSRLIQGLFRDPLDHLVEHIRDLLCKPSVKGSSAFLLVGGFSESPIVQDTIKEKFPKMKVIVPAEPSLAVLKGAVMYGHRPTTITTRVARQTYGVAISKPFIEGHHPEDKKQSTRGVVVCKDIFHKYVQEGDPLELGEKQTMPFTSASSVNRIRVYASSDPDPIYVTDEGCSLLGEMILNLSMVENSGNTIEVSMEFGGVEISVEAREKHSGRTVRSRFDFLSKN